MPKVQGDPGLKGQEKQGKSKARPRRTGRAAPTAAPVAEKRTGRAAPTAAPAAEKRTGRAAPTAAPAAERRTGRAAPTAAPAVEKRPPRLLERYCKEIVPTLMKEFNYRGPMEVPRLKKVVINIGLGEALTNPRALESATRDLSLITGQKPVVTRARKSIAAFKLRSGAAIGAAVTLRGKRMMYFLDRLVNMALPRIRDFRGVSRSSFDGRGGYSLGVREQIIFPEIEYGQIDRIRGFQVTIVTSARTDREAERLLELLGMPFARQS